MVVKGGSQRQNMFMGVDSTTGKQTTAFLNPISVSWRCEPPFTIMFLKALSTPTVVEISRLSGLLEGGRRVRGQSSKVCMEMLSTCSPKGGRSIFEADGATPRSAN